MGSSQWSDREFLHAFQPRQPFLLVVAQPPTGEVCEAQRLATSESRSRARRLCDGPFSCLDEFPETPMDLQTFQAFARDFNVIPLSRTLAADTLTPVAIYLAARSAGERGFLFESVEGGRHVARYSLLGLSPRERITAHRGEVAAVRDGALLARGASLPEVLKARLGTFRPCEGPGLPRFGGGYVGHLGYNCAAATERVPVKADPLGVPEATLYRFDDLVAFDHVESRVVLIANALPDEHPSPEAAYQDAEARLARLERMVRRAGAVPLQPQAADLPEAPAAAREAFLAGVAKAKGHIVDGDIYQVVLSIQERIPFGGDPFDVYRLLRMSNPSPYHFFLEQDEAVILGASPEMLARVEDGRMEVRPIAGTRPRGATPAEDLALREELLADPKEGAEHVMLVDLGRNDAGRVCQCGSVQVAAFRTVEPYSHVMHLVSSVTGRLREDVHPVDAFFAAFPAGTVSGAPKIRAMEIIHDLEPAARGVYSGAVGYFDYRGNTDTCIAIRSTVIKDGYALVQAGAGIVADSVPEREHDECRHKMAPVKAALAAAPAPRPGRPGPACPL
jgi:anthranilate synthase component 1